MHPLTTTPHTGPGTDPEPWLSKAQLALHYGASTRTVERWMFTGCPSRLVGSLRRFRLSEVELWLDDQAEGPVTGPRTTPRHDNLNQEA